MLLCEIVIIVLFFSEDKTFVIIKFSEIASVFDVASSSIKIGASRMIALAKDIYCF